MRIQKNEHLKGTNTVLRKINTYVYVDNDSSFLKSQKSNLGA